LASTDLAGARPQGRRPILALSLGLFASAPVPARAADALRFADLYAGGGVLGLVFSERLRSLAGKAVKIRGFMAPPLRIEAEFFVLTREPTALCPFCSTDADWPSDIVVVRLAEASLPVSWQAPIEVEGRLELGPAIDADTGFVSQIRVVDAVFRTV